MVPTPPAGSTLPRRRLRVGRLCVDEVTFAGALDALQGLVEAGNGGTVFTPNVDHVVLAEDDARFRAAYDAASLSLVDGAPVIWASWLLGLPLPEKVSGSDLLLPAVERASARGWRVYLLGGAEGVAALAADRLRERFPGLVIAGVDSPRIDVDESPARRAEIVARVREARPELVFVALGAPKQEIWSHEVSAALRPAVLVGVGAAIDFVAGTARRAPRWMSDAGLEWAYRMGQEPRRLWRRYLLRDPRFLAILARSLRTPAADRIVTRP